MQHHGAEAIRPEAFIALAEGADIDARIAAKEQELQATRQAAQLQQKAALSAVTVPVFPRGVEALLPDTFANVAADAERQGSQC